MLFWLAMFGLSYYLLHRLNQKDIDVDIIFMILLFVNSIYIAIRQYFFAGMLKNQYIEQTQQVLEIFKNKYPEDAESYLRFTEVVDLSTYFYTSFSPGLWIALMMLALLIGYFITFRHLDSYVPINKFQVHVYICYLSIAALGVCLIPDYKLIGINILIGIIPLFLVQGIAVAKHKLTNWISHSTFIKVLAVICIIINPYVVLFLAIIGLFDNWLDFRKIYKITTENSEENIGGDE